MTHRQLFRAPPGISAPPPPTRPAACVDSPEAAGLVVTASRESLPRVTGCDASGGGTCRRVGAFPFILVGAWKLKRTAGSVEELLTECMARYIGSGRKVPGVGGCWCICRTDSYFSVQGWSNRPRFALVCRGRRPVAWEREGRRHPYTVL